MPDKELYTTGEISRMIGVAEKTVRNYCERGLLRCHKTPITGYRRISRKDLLAFMNDHNLSTSLLNCTPAKRILIADNNEDLRKALCSILSRAFGKRIAIETARGGYETCIMAGAFAPALLLLDLVMPRTDGLEVCRSLRANKRTRSLDIVVLSGFVDLADRGELESLGIKHLLRKPVPQEELVAVIKEYLWKRRVPAGGRKAVI